MRGAHQATSSGLHAARERVLQTLLCGAACYTCISLAQISTWPGPPNCRREGGKTATLRAPLGDIPLHMLGGTVSCGATAASGASAVRCVRCVCAAPLPALCTCWACVLRLAAC